MQSTDVTVMREALCMTSRLRDRYTYRRVSLWLNFSAGERGDADQLLLQEQKKLIIPHAVPNPTLRVCSAALREAVLSEPVDLMEDPTGIDIDIDTDGGSRSSDEECQSSEETKDEKQEAGDT